MNADDELGVFELRRTATEYGPEVVFRFSGDVDLDDFVTYVIDFMRASGYSINHGDLDYRPKDEPQ